MLMTLIFHVSAIRCKLLFLQDLKSYRIPWHCKIALLHDLCRSSGGAKSRIRGFRATDRDTSGGGLRDISADRIFRNGGDMTRWPRYDVTALRIDLRADKAFCDLQDARLDGCRPPKDFISIWWRKIEFFVWIRRRMGWLPFSSNIFEEVSVYEWILITRIKCLRTEFTSRIR